MNAHIEPRCAAADANTAQEPEEQDFEALDEEDAFLSDEQVEYIREHIPDFLHDQHIILRYLMSGGTLDGIYALQQMQVPAECSSCDEAPEEA